METAVTIVQAAEQLLVEQGYAASSTNAIARRAGVSVGSLYQYFADKEDVFRAVVARHRAAVMPVIAAALARMAEEDSELVEVSLDLLREMARVNAENPRLMAAIEGELGWLEHEGHAARDLREQVVAILELRTALPRARLVATAEILILTLSPLSRWLVHAKPEALDTELFVASVGRMLRALLEP